MKTYNEAGDRALLVPRDEWLAAKKIIESLKLYDIPLSCIISEGQIAKLLINDDAVTVTTVRGRVRRTVKCFWDGETEVKEVG